MDKPLIPAHGGYRSLAAFQMSEIVYDATVAYGNLAIDARSRTKDQMVQAARSGRQNIAEGSQASGTTKKTELKLVNVARASFEELLLDYEDDLRQHGLRQWAKEAPKAIKSRSPTSIEDRSYETYRNCVDKKGRENTANTVLCLIHQTNYLLDRLRQRLDRDFRPEGGFTERRYRE